MADTNEKVADFQHMYAMLKVHSANQAKEIERLTEEVARLTATPPADAALADALKWAINEAAYAARHDDGTEFWRVPRERLSALRAMLAASKEAP